MPDDTPSPLHVFLQLAAALAEERHEDVAALCHPGALRQFQSNQILAFRGSGSDLTVEQLRRHQPDLPLEVAEYQVTQSRRREEERRRNIGAEIDGVSSVEELESLTPVDCFARWLRAQTLRNRIRHVVASGILPRRALAEVDRIPRPLERLVPLGEVRESPDVSHVVYRRELRPMLHQAAADTLAYQQWLATLHPDEREWAAVPGSADHGVYVMTFRHYHDGTWRAPADHSLLGNGGLWGISISPELGEEEHGPETPEGERSS